MNSTGSKQNIHTSKSQGDNAVIVCEGLTDKGLVWEVVEEGFIH